MIQRPFQPNRLLMLAAWSVAIVAGTMLRLWQIEIQLPLDDEWHALHRVMQAGYREILLSFGHADYSVPLTLLFRFLAETVGLDDFSLRFLPMSFGLAAIVLIPRLMAPWLDGRERVLLALLIAISPLLIHFSRYIRPYSLTVLLGFSALILLWRWGQEGNRWQAFGFATCAVLAVWLHALAALFIGAALLWLTGQALLNWRRGHGPRDLIRVLLLGGGTTLLCCALVLPPLLGHPEAIEVKAGQDRITLETLARSWEMVLGVGHGWLAAVLSVPVLAGVWRLACRAPAFVAYWAWSTAAAVLVIQLIGPEWIQNALVVVRYTSIAQPFVLALLAVGTIELLGRVPPTWLWQERSALVLAPAFAVVGVVFLAGPLPTVYEGINQFTNAARYQVDYDFERSVYHDLMAPLELPEPYRRMVAEPGDWVVVEAAWHFESNFSPISQYQRDHQLPIEIGMISGLCTDWTWGELRPGDDLDIELDRFVFLRDVLRSEGEINRFVVFPLSNPFDHERRPLPDLEPCIEAFEERTGPPWYKSEDFVVFRFPASVREDGS